MGRWAGGPRFLTVQILHSKKTRTTMRSDFSIDFEFTPGRNVTNNCVNHSNTCYKSLNTALKVSKILSVQILHSPQIQSYICSCYELDRSTNGQQGKGARRRKAAAISVVR